MAKTRHIAVLWRPGRAMKECPYDTGGKDQRYSSLCPIPALLFVAGVVGGAKDRERRLQGPAVD